jgi:membrane associated rhomboid family serine protease
MYVLLLVGNPVNRRLGSFYYACTYVGTIVLMGLLGRAMGLGPLLGASGAIFCIIAIFIMLMPAAIVSMCYVALFPVSVLIGLFKQPDEWREWFIRWGRFCIRAWLSVFIVPVLELWGIFWSRTALGDWQWNNLAHLLGLFCGVVIVLLLPRDITMGKHVRISST